MLNRYRVIAAACLLVLVAPLALAAESTSPAPHRVFRVILDGASGQPVSGRLLLFATLKADATKQARDGKVTRVDTSAFFPTQTAVAATNVLHLAPGKSVLIDADSLAFPKPMSELAAGQYVVQAVLDVNRDYAYAGRGPGDLVSPVTELTFNSDAAVATLKLTRELPPEGKAWTASKRMPAKAREMYAPKLEAAHAQSRRIDFQSPALSQFWGRPMHVTGWVLLPPGYDKDKTAHYPTVYFTHGFGGSDSGLTFTAGMLYAGMLDGGVPPMIWVLLNQGGPHGTHEFADSVNNGPWGAALTAELIPHLESHYRMDGDTNGRFLTGHSSGGWATLWLQTRYPKTFGGTWSTSPDSSDFRNFTGPNIYAPDANVYDQADGTPYPLVRAKGKVIATFKQFAQLERVLGPYGGQMSSFDWVFSPRGRDGRPMPLFDRDTGKVDPEVARYWRDHYDIAYRIKTQWPELKADLDGKIHVIVGTADTFYLNESAAKLKQVLDSVHAKAEVEFLPGKTHMDLFSKDDNPYWLMQQIAWAMYHEARPKAIIPDQYRHEIHD